MLRSVTVCLLLAVAVLAVGCAPSSGSQADDGRLNVVATTSMLADLARQIAGEHADVTGLMGPGVDPHLYRAKAGDVQRMSGADLVLYNGLHLEGKMSELFEEVRARGQQTLAVAETIDPARRLESDAFQGNFDPHIWFDVTLWQDAARAVAGALAAADSSNADAYAAGLDDYLAELDALEAWVRSRVAEVPGDRRVLITSHDAFGYFGRAYGFEVMGLQGISTATEAGTADVQSLAEEVAERRIPALFVESSVSPRGIEAVREAVRARGHEVAIGGNLYSDALGSPGTDAETYIGTVRHNVDTIVGALGGERVGV